MLGTKAMNNLALVYRYQDKYPQAEALYVTALAAQRRLTGEEDIATLTSMNDLGSLYHRQASPELAEPLLCQGDGVGSPRARRRASRDGDAEQ